MRGLRRRAASLLPLSLRRSLAHAGRRVRAPFYRGSRNTCPCCGQSWRRFLRAGVQRREGALCPGCGAYERHRLLWLYITRSTPLLSAPLRVLHVAPEGVFQSRLQSRPQLDYVSGDLASPLAEHHFDLQAIPFPDGDFDAILCNHVLEHVPDDHLALAELYRVLRPGGFAILQHPVDRQREKTYEDPSITTPEGRERAFGQWDHLRVYGADFDDRVRAQGFSLEWIPIGKQLADEELQRYGLRKSMRVCHCTRPAA